MCELILIGAVLVVSVALLATLGVGLILYAVPILGVGAWVGEQVAGSDGAAGGAVASGIIGAILVFGPLQDSDLGMAATFLLLAGVAGVLGGLIGGGIAGAVGEGSSGPQRGGK